MNSNTNIDAHLSIGPNVNCQKTSLVSLSFFTSIWWITVDMLVINVVYFGLGSKYLNLLKKLIYCI